jgi:SAM-dependent methyltransferase
MLSKLRLLIKGILLKISPVYRAVNGTRIQLNIMQNSLIEMENNNQIQWENIQKKLLTSKKFHFEQEGYCPICNENVIFYSENTWLRDNFLCKNCGSIPRQRALMTVIEKCYPNWRDLSIHESSPGNCSITTKLERECKGYVKSQYYHNQEFGKIINECRNENLEDQTFEDKIFDIVITQDVFEHIFNPEKAFLEISRTLKNGGSHIFTVPIINKFNESEIWATMGTNGEAVFRKTEEWHGNPIDEKGSPVTMHWGYDIVDYIEKYSGLKTKIEYIHNLHFGIWAEYIEVFVSKKI